MQLTATKMSALNPVPEKKYPTPGEVILFLRRVEAVFDLPHESLSQKRDSSGRPKKNINDKPLSDIRRAAILHLVTNTNMPPSILSFYVGQRSDNFYSSINRAKELLQIGDERFTWCYEIIKTIEL